MESTKFGRAYWEDRYRDHAGSHGAEPNRQLPAEAGDLAPGEALDAGCGRGADAIWLASRGWRVTAVDIAAPALEHARERAEALGPAVADRIEWIRADLTGWTLPEGRFDLVSAHYVHPQSGRYDLFGRLAGAVAPGGTLLIVDHQPHDGHQSHDDHQPHDEPEVHVTADEIAAVLDPARWDVVTAEARTRTVIGHDRREITMHDAVLRAVRRA
ncbi:class I SAM-dependent methyltransferase [Spongiactinospora sp. TRM90649]|uniref:class I SAM-dependent methyltransferase n=1 Tax=Spongiactinospora sp. TRM90649 TaxID=3031114 RepID=UPI0023F83CF3|nr:class I SAM-dependent methyltransferase [Spongiactinospora sp. TRM90649]MDF5755941.1 class I SAM-dependent methyltransferase [Spongiactinospora sp. TRM90649]